MSDVVKKVTSKKIIELLRINRHPNIKGEWATFTEVRNGTGFVRQERYMDLFALSCWPSKGFRSVAYEVKVDRSDFMRELLDPTKRAFAESCAMECWFATPSGLVTKDEIPEGWGLVTVDKNGDLKTVKMPTQRTPAPWGMPFIATLLRKASEPASEVPLPMWKVAGKDLTMEELKAVFAAEVEVIRRELTLDIRAEERKLHEEGKRTLESQVREGARLHTMVGNYLGLTPYETNLFSKDQLIKKLETFKSGSVTPATHALLTKASIALDELLATLERP